MIRKGKIKYQGGITKFLCQNIANRQKNNFKKLILEKRLLPLNCRTIDFDVISFSGAVSFEDQILSIYSFVYYAGLPVKWTIYSDGTYCPKDIELIKTLFSFITVKEWNYNNNSDDKDLLDNYVKRFPTAKKVSIVTGHKYERQTIYVDSDIVFYKNIFPYINSTALSKGFWYVPDAVETVEAYFKNDDQNIYAFNFGLIILNSTFDFGDVFTFLNDLKGNYVYFSDQLAFEYAFRKQNGAVLDPRQFIIDTDDQFDYSTKYRPRDIAMRHYTGPVRHKMWQNGWKWHFDI